MANLIVVVSEHPLATILLAICLSGSIGAIGAAVKEARNAGRP